MTTERWSVDQLGALADEWLAEREAFLSSVQMYLSTHLPRTEPAQRQLLAPDVYQAEMAAISARLHDFLRTMDGAVWYTLQQRLDAFQRDLEARFGAAAHADAERLAVMRPLPDTAAAHRAVRQAMALLQHILRVYQDLQGRFDFATIRFAARLASHMKYLLYPVRLQLPALTRYWLLEGTDLQVCEPPPSQVEANTGIQHYTPDKQRGAYTTYVPEYYRADHPWPLLLTLHGGSGNDVDFLWTWLKYAKSHGYLLISAKSFAQTWYPWDAQSLLLILDEVQERYHIDTRRILLTGLSDGGSFGYEVGFAFPERFAGLAVVAGILRPHQRHPQASQLPVYVAHGERDQLFPVEYIRMVVTKLREWGHAVTYHELEGFGHAYPPGENTTILTWFEGLSHMP